MLDIKDLTVRYNSMDRVTAAVNGISLSIEKGSFTGLEHVFILAHDWCQMNEGRDIPAIRLIKQDIFRC